MISRQLGSTGPRVSALRRAVPPGAAAGDRYDPSQMAHLDSERAAKP
jgi:hypothetical protein